MSVASVRWCSCTLEHHCSSKQLYVRSGPCSKVPACSYEARSAEPNGSSTSIKSHVVSESFKLIHRCVVSVFGSVHFANTREHSRTLANIVREMFARCSRDVREMFADVRMLYPFTPSHTLSCAHYRCRAAMRPVSGCTKYPGQIRPGAIIRIGSGYTKYNGRSPAALSTRAALRLQEVPDRCT